MEQLSLYLHQSFLFDESHNGFKNKIVQNACKNHPCKEGLYCSWDSMTNTTSLPIFLGENFQEAKEIAGQINNFDKNTQYYVLIYRVDPAELDLGPGHLPYPQECLNSTWLIVNPVYDENNLYL